MNAETTLMVAQQQIGRALAEIATLKTPEKSPLVWAEKVIEQFTDFWNFEFKPDEKKQAQIISKMFSDFALGLRDKMDYSTLDSSIYLGYISTLVFVLNLHIKANGKVEVKPGNELMEALSHNVSMAHISENLKTPIMSIEELLRETMERELQTKRMQSSILSLLKKIAKVEDLKGLGNSLGLPLGENKRYEEGTNRFFREGASQRNLMNESGKQTFSFGDLPIVPKFPLQSTGTPNFGGVTTTKIENKSAIPNNEKLSNLFQERLKKVDVGRKSKEAGPVFPVMQSFGDFLLKDYPKFKPVGEKKLERYSHSKHSASSSARSNDRSSPLPANRTFASSSFRMPVAVIRQKKEKKPSKYLLNNLNCRDFDHFIERIERRRARVSGTLICHDSNSKDSRPEQPGVSIQENVIDFPLNGRPMDVEAREESSDESEEVDYQVDVGYELHVEDWCCEIVAFSTPPLEGEN